MAEITRRLLLKLAGCGSVSAMAAGMGIKNAQRLIPLVIPPTEDFHPGKWMHYATTCRECPAGCGMHARCVDGRVQKSEGNPAHPLSVGGLCPRGQSAVQGLYDPDRIRGPLRRQGSGQVQTSLSAALEEIAAALKAPDARLAIISDVQTGALADLLRNVAAAFGTGRVLMYEPFNYEPLRDAHQLAFSRPVIPRYRLDRAGFILSFGADFLETWLSPVEFARAFADRHGTPQAVNDHFVYAGPRLSMTAANADKYYAMSPRQMLTLAVAILRKAIDLKLTREDISTIEPAIDGFLAGVAAGTVAESDLPLNDAEVTALTRAFMQADGAVALAGPVGMNDYLSRQTALAAAFLNYAAGSVGKTVDFSQTHALSAAAGDEQITKFLAELTKQDVLLVMNANIVYTRHDGESIRNAGKIAYLGTMLDETAALADWVLPIDSPLEAWGDYEPWTGVHCLQQPAMKRLHETCQAGDIVLTLAGLAGKEIKLADGTPAENFDAWIEHRWRLIHKQQGSGGDFETFWTECLRRGGLFQTPPPADVRLAPSASQWQPALPKQSEWRYNEPIALWFWASVMFFDGRGANRSWLQEAPDPMRTIVWDNWMELHPSTPPGKSLKDGMVVELHQARAPDLEAPLVITDDIVPGVAGLCFGQGHTALGTVAANRGYNAFQVARLSKEGFYTSYSFEPTDRRHELANLSASQHQYHRELLHWTDAQSAASAPAGADAPEHYRLPLPEGYSQAKDLYAAPKYKQYRWGMVIDLERCTGCGACAVACYAENNIAVMGKGQCLAGREMAWLKVTPYRRQDNPRQVGWMVLPCQHCDDAPCEPVCPVFAAVHNEEGINAQVYNRCIGTRYCNNNCPYKVRRFNWINIDWKKPLDWPLNPEVTVRQRGVMEKCSFCIQRIKQAQYSSRRHRRKIKDGEIQPACGQSCPTRAIIFGNLLDENSEVGRLTRTDPRRYHVLGELNTKPAVAYLKRINKDVPQLGEY